MQYFADLWWPKYTFIDFFSHILDQRQIPFVLVCITPKVNIFHETLSYVADKIFKLSTTQVYAVYTAGLGVHCFDPRRLEIHVRGQDRFFLTCPVLTYLLLYLYKNKCGSGHRKLCVYVVKNPDHISAYITFSNSLQLPRTKELVLGQLHTYTLV